MELELPPLWARWSRSCRRSRLGGVGAAAALGSVGSPSGRRAAEGGRSRRRRRCGARRSRSPGSARWSAAAALPGQSRSRRAARNMRLVLLLAACLALAAASPQQGILVRGRAPRRLRLASSPRRPGVWLRAPLHYTPPDTGRHFTSAVTRYTLNTSQQHN